MCLKLIFVTFLIHIVLQGCNASAYSDPHFAGDRRVIVHLMEWKYEDIAKECELFLGPYGYAGVQLSPVNENAVLDKRPWYERYQPVSYKLVTRSGNEDQFRDMVDRCNKAGVRIYVDIVLNHMTGGSNGKGTAGSSYDGNSMNYEGVPFSSLDFHGHESCPTSDLEIHNYDDPKEARNCRLVGLRDLNQGKDYVREKQAAFLNHMIEIGVAGFRSDASKHMWPEDLENIYSRLHNLNTKYFPSNSKPFIYHEVIYYGGNGIKSSDYTKIGRAIEFHYYRDMGDVFRKHNNQQLKYLKNYGEGWGLVPSGDALVMIDSHDLQRGHTGSFGTNINYFESKLLKMATTFMLAWPYGVTRVMSSYSWPRNIQGNSDTNDWMGPPHDGNYNIASVTRNADLSCGKEWICEHRWRQIYNMAKFRNVAGDEPMANWWDNSANQIAFSRGHKAFIAINNDNSPLNKKLQTGLPAGHYCDIISGSLSGGKCTGTQVTVGSDGTADISIDNKSEDPMIAIHISAKL